MGRSKDSGWGPAEFCVAIPGEPTDMTRFLRRERSFLKTMILQKRNRLRLNKKTEHG